MAVAALLGAGYLYWTIASRGSAFALAGATQSNDALATPYHAASFDERTIAADFKVFSGQWTAERGRLTGKLFQEDLEAAGYMDGDRPTSFPIALIWFKKPLPPEFEVSWKARALKNAGDLNAYFCGGGGDISGYDLVFGGWDNSSSRLLQVVSPTDLDGRIRLDKIKPDSIRLGAEYEFRVRRTREGIEIYRNGSLVMSHNEKGQPLLGADQRYFGLSTWNNKAEFWDLRIDPNPQAP